jgi:flagellar FliL protein
MSMLKDKKILAGGGAVVLALGGWFFVKPSYFDAKPAPVYTEAQIAEAPRPTVTLAERVLNLKAPASSPNYVKAVIALEFADPEHRWVGLKGKRLEEKNEHFSEELKPELVRVWDVITRVVGSHSIDELSTPDGREKLKAELAESINDEMHGEKVEKVYFVTFVTQ